MMNPKTVVTNRYWRVPKCEVLETAMIFGRSHCDQCEPLAHAPAA